MFGLKFFKFALFCVVFSVFLNANCLECHEKIEKFELVNHDFSCEKCHLKKEDQTSKDHAKIVAHPASNENMSEFCGECHDEHIKSYKNSNHFTHKNEINAILMAFGIDKNASINEFANLKNLSEKQKFGIDIIQNKCLNCHTGSQGQNGAFRGLGCMACHTEYANAGKYHGKDEFAGTTLHSKTHEMKKAGSDACLSCHNKYFVGADFMGQFLIDTHKDFRTPLDKNGNFHGKFKGDFYHNLSQDIHANLGFSCVDCHTSHNENQAKFDDFFKNNKSDFKTKSCENCHEISPNFAHASYHEGLVCTSCHASWQGSFYELNLIKDESKNAKKWENILDFWGGKKNYHAVFSLSRFENVFLLNDAKSGKIALGRPNFQYNLMQISKNGEEVSLNDKREFEAFAPFSPHTVSKQAKNCELCHENPLQSGKSYGGVSEFFTPSDNAKFINSTPLTKEQQNRLNSPLYKKTRAKMLNQN